MATPVDTSTILAAQAGDSDAMWTVLEAHEPFMKSLVRTVAPAANAEDAEDLLQEARVALMERLRDYSTDAPASLATYARSAVQRAVSSHYLKSSSQLSIEPSTAIAVKHALWVAEGNADRAWSIVEAAGSMSRERFVSMCEAFVDADSLDAPIGDSEDALTLADVTEDTSLDAMDPTERRDTARRLLEVIKPRQSFALRAFYGIRMTPLTDEQASDELGLSGRGKSAALRQLRQRGINSARTQAARFGIAA